MSAFDYPFPGCAADGTTVCAECCCVALDESTYYHPTSETLGAVTMTGRAAEATPFCSRSCFLYWQWRQEKKAVASS